MSKEKKSLFHFEYKTDEDVKRENQELAKSVTEDKKSEYVFNGEDLYYIGVGHAFLYGFFNEYLTKSGIKAWQYHSGWWSIGNDRYDYIDGEFVLVPPTPPSEPIDWASIQFPKVKNLTGPIAGKLISVQPKENPNE